MKPFFGVLVLICIFFFTKIETAGNLNKIKTKYRDKAAELDDQARRDDHRTTLIIGTPARPKKQRSVRQKPRAVRESRPEFEHECALDETGGKAYKMFLDHYKEREIPNAPDNTLSLYNERHASGSYRSPEKKFAHYYNKQEVYDEVRKRYDEPYVQEHHQQMYQQHQALQDHSGGSGSSSKGLDAYNRYKNVYTVGDQSDQSGLGTGNNYRYTSPPMTPAENLTSYFNIHPPEHFNVEENSSQNNISATTLIENYNVNLRRKYGDRSRGSSSG